MGIAKSNKTQEKLAAMEKSMEKIDNSDEAGFPLFEKKLKEMERQYEERIDAAIDRMLEIKEMEIGQLSDKAYYYALELIDLKEDLITKNATKNE